MIQEGKYEFGVAKLEGERADWLVQNASTSTNAQEALALNEDGEPIVAHYYQNIEEMSFEVIIPTSAETAQDSSSNIPEVGDIFTYDGKKWYVSASQVSATNTDFKRYTLTCKRFTKPNNGAGLPA